MRSLAFNRGKRLSEGTLVEAHVEGRVLGLRLLKIDALVALVPASPAAFEAVGLVQSGRSMSAVRNGSSIACIKVRPWRFRTVSPLWVSMPLPGVPGG